MQEIKEVNIEKIWTQIYQQLLGFVSKYVTNTDDAQDIVQDTFIKVKTNIEKLENPSKIEKWIYQIARNTMNDYFRKQKKRFEEDNSVDVIVEPTAFNNEDILVQIQTTKFSKYAGFVINELPEKYKKAVFMADIEGLKMKEVAEELNLSVSGAKSRVQRGRKLIKEIILKCCDVNTDKYGNIIDYEPRNCEYKS